MFGVTADDDTAAALDSVERLKSFFASLGLPVTFAQLGVSDPDIATLVKKLHENKGEEIGGYRRLRAADTEAIYRLAL